MSSEQNILKALLSKPNVSYGICRLVVKASCSEEEKDHFQKTMIKLAEDLGIYSGGHKYPIASGDVKHNAYQAYSEYLSLWDKDTEYGRRRIMLHAALIQHYSEAASFIKSLELLIKRLDKVPTKNSYGICSMVRPIVLHHEEFKKAIIAACSDLGIYSGDPTYPIKHEDYDNPVRAFDACNDLWDESTKYGRDRRAVKELTLAKLRNLLDETSI